MPGRQETSVAEHIADIAKNPKVLVPAKRRTDDDRGAVLCCGPGASPKGTTLSFFCSTGKSGREETIAAIDPEELQTYHLLKARVHANDT